ncbi:MAG: RNA polymerase sigma factor [Myxococcota bacterium]
MSAAHSRRLEDATARLIEAAARGEHNAFEALYREHVGIVYALCARLAGDNRLAEELTQQVFVRAWQRLSGFRGGSFRRWLRRIAVRITLDDRRSHQRRRARVTLGETDRPIDAPDPCVAPDGARLDLERAIARLPPKARHILVLATIEGWSHAEIAGFLGVAEGTSKAQLHRARQLLQEALS